MSRSRSALILIVVPAVASLAVTLLVLNIWDRQQGPEYIMLPTHSGTALVPPRETLPPDASGMDPEQLGEPGEEEGEAAVIPAGCENPVHSVASGETLSVIAESYGVLLDDVIVINEMIDPAFNANFLSIGQEVVIPECGIPTPTPTAIPTATTVPTRTIPTPGPTGTEPPSGLIRVEIARVLNPGDITSEAVEIINRGTSVARLGGWALRSEDGSVSFVFPPLNLFPQGAVTVYSGVGENTAIDVYWGRDSAAWSVGDTVLLTNADGERQHEFTIPAR